VIVVMLENRAFDHILGYLNRNDSRIVGLTGNECNFMVPSDPSSGSVCVTAAAPDIAPGDPGAFAQRQKGHGAGVAARLARVAASGPRDPDANGAVPTSPQTTR
jgi:hypothetical protein